MVVYILFQIVLAIVFLVADYRNQMNKKRKTNYFNIYALICVLVNYAIIFAIDLIM